MKLTHVRVENFRSIEDTGTFEVDDLTCLVGKNEAGKTAVLQALQGLWPFGKAQTKFDLTKEYPRRHVTRYQQRHGSSEAKAVSTTWRMDSVSRQALADEFGESALSGESVQVTKYYNSEGTTWNMPLNEAQAVKNLVEQAQFSAAERKTLQAATSIKALTTALADVSETTAKHTALQTRIKGYRDGSLMKKAIDLISGFMPRFFYVSHYDRMSGALSVIQLKQDQSKGQVDTGDQIFLDFLKLAGTSLDELESTTQYEDLKAQLEAASNDITEQIFKYWTQNDALEVHLDLAQGKSEDPAPFDTGTIVRARVWNSLHRASVPFSERSAGFVWFFSFLVQFAAMRREAGNVVILLDEPGLTLHGKAQADLLRYIEEELLPHHQVIFSTHSPFMVPADRFASVRIVEDVVDRTRPGRPEVKGTKVRSDVLVTDQDTLFPLQGALGYDLAQSLFVGKDTLLVEGPSDILYLQALSEALKRRGRTGLDQRWTLCPAGGIDKIRPFVTLFGGNHLNVAVLSDFSVGDKKKVEELRRSEILQSGKFYTAADFTEKTEADIEDLFEPHLFARVVNSAYMLSSEHELSPESLAATQPPTVRQVKQAEALFRVLPESVPMFDHFTPASWLLRNPSLLDEESPEVLATLARAERVFETFNPLLS